MKQKGGGARIALGRFQCNQINVKNSTIFLNLMMKSFNDIFQLHKYFLFCFIIRFLDK